MTYSSVLSNAEQAVAVRIADGFPHIAPYATGIAVSAIQVCAEALLAEAANAQPGPYRQGLEDAAALLTGDDSDSHVVIPLPRRADRLQSVPDGAA